MQSIPPRMSDVLSVSPGWPAFLHGHNGVYQGKDGFDGLIIAKSISVYQSRLLFDLKCLNAFILPETHPYMFFTAAVYNNWL